MSHYPAKGSYHALLFLKMQIKSSDHFGPKVRHIKYVSLLEADFRVLDTVKDDMVFLDVSFNSTLRQMICRGFWYLGEVPISPLVCHQQG